MKQPQVYEVDLSKIRGEGDFSCPNCGITLSPEDETEEVYCILETKVIGQGLEQLLIQCNKCGSEIRLVGFLIARARMSEFICPECGVYIDQAEQDKVKANCYVCGNCFTVIYRQKRIQCARA